MAKNEQNGKAKNATKPAEGKKPTCGIIMPISGNDVYSAAHWSDVKIILDEVIEDAGFFPSLVSDADDVGIIHNRIVSNIHNNPIVVCDVSSKNPNVMFELGLRLAFDKATIIIKDDVTSYNFDTGVIEHLPYPKDLRYGAINNFKVKLKDKLVSTFKASKNADYSTFLKSFIQYKPKIEEKEVSYTEYINKALLEVNQELAEIRRSIQNNNEKPYPYTPPPTFVRRTISTARKLQFNEMIAQYIAENKISNVDLATIKAFIDHLKVMPSDQELDYILYKFPIEVNKKMTVNG